MRNYGGFPGMRRGRRRRSDGIDPRLMLLLMQLGRQIMRMRYKPPVTLAIMALNAAIYLYKNLIPFSLQESCLHPQKILMTGDWKRVFLSAFFHADDYHLYYNMTSLLWKGAQLEEKLGSEGFIQMTVILLTLSHTIYILAAWLLSPWGLASMQTCAVGYSAVLFAYKVVLNYDSPRMSHFWGIPVPLKYMCWAELVMISMISPNASFLGHLCGILAGLIYLNFSSLVAFVTPQPVQRSGATIRNGNIQRPHMGNRSEEEDIQEALRRSMADQQQRTRNTSNRTNYSSHGNDGSVGSSNNHNNNNFSSNYSNSSSSNNRDDDDFIRRRRMARFMQ